MVFGSGGMKTLRILLYIASLKNPMFFFKQTAKLGEGKMADEKKTAVGFEKTGQQETYPETGKVEFSMRKQGEIQPHPDPTVFRCCAKVGMATEIWPR